MAARGRAESATRAGRSKKARGWEKRTLGQERSLEARRLAAEHVREVLANRSRALAPKSVPGVRAPVTRSLTRTAPDASRFEGTERLDAN